LAAPTVLSCLACGTTTTRSDAAICRRCGLPYGTEPPASAPVPECPVCYREADRDGRFPSLVRPGQRVELHVHREEHERYPVGDDDWLETLRVHDRIRIGRWTAPFELVRRYLVTGVVDAGRARLERHTAILDAMVQVSRFGPGASILGDQQAWRDAREAVEVLMERYHRTARPGRAW
jgi:hypothetical protein